MTLARGFTTTIISGLVGGLIGLGLGYLAGTYAPDYYRITFDIPNDVRYDTVQLGMGLGSTQGLVGGLVVGLGIVLVVAWFQIRTTNALYPVCKQALGSPDLADKLGVGARGDFVVGHDVQSGQVSLKQASEGEAKL